MSKLFVNKKHFVTDSVVLYAGKRKRCRLTINLIKRSNGCFSVTKIAFKRLLARHDYEDYSLAVNCFRVMISDYLFVD